jgi:integrase
MTLTKPIILTKTSVDDAAYTNDTTTPNARCVVWDAKVPGFGLRIYPGGKKTFIISYRAAGRKRQMTLGAYGVLTVDQARARARVLLTQVLTSDSDPLAERERERQGETMADLCAAYLARHAPTKKTGDQDRSRIERHILPAWGSLKVTAVTRGDLARLHNRLGLKTPYEANRLLALLSKMFDLARVWGFVPDSHPNPARDIDRFKEHKRDRWVTPAELPRLAQAINEEPNAAARHALWLYLLTGCRKTELLEAKWIDIDWDRAELRKADTKAGRVHYIPLSAPALALLRDIVPTPGNPYVLPGRGHRGMSAEEQARHPHHLVNISKPLARVLAAAGVADVRLHDLRRTVGSWLAQAGNSLHLIGRVLDHSNASTTAVYARFGEDAVRNALEQHGARIMGIAGLAPTAEVVPFAKKSAVDKA